MKFSKWAIAIVPVIVSLATSCGNEAQNRAIKSKRGANGKDPMTETAQAIAESKAPKLMIARVALDDMNKESAKVEFVAIDSTTSIANGQDAASAFSAGKPINNDNSGALSLASGSDIRFDLGMNPQNPAQVGQTPCGQVRPCPQQVPQNPCGQINPCERPRIKHCRCNFIGGILSFIAGIGQTAITGVGTILTQLNPLAWIGNTGVGYGYNNQYNYGKYNYSVYQQTPGKIPNNPIQGNPGGEPMPGFQPPIYTNGGYTQPGYTQPGYTQPSGYPQNQQQQSPAGQEPMPSNLRAN